MSIHNLPWLASLIRSRNTIDNKIAALIERSAQAGNVGEYIAATIFRIDIEEDGRQKGYDGRFTHGRLAGCTVDIQWHTRHSGQMNIRQEVLPDYYLILAGPSVSSSGHANPWLIQSIYLFHAKTLLAGLREHGVQIGSGTSVTGPLWDRAEIYPVAHSNALVLSDEERQLLIQFG